jgi:sigma-B regulation protein RsbU (phosphoserine phosphatase)
VYSNAAHPMAIHIRKGKAQTLSAEGMYIGISETMTDTFQTVRINLEPEDKIILYTDGIIETKGRAEEPYGLDRLTGIALEYWQKPCDVMLDAVIKDFTGFTGKTAHTDDETIMIIGMK